MEPRSSRANDDSVLENPVSDRQLSPETASLADAIGASLTVIKGHAQLIRRRARGRDDDDNDDAVALERSVVAIELAVARIMVALATASHDLETYVRDPDTEE